MTTNHQGHAPCLIIVRLEKGGIEEQGTTDQQGLLVHTGTHGKGHVKGVLREYENEKNVRKQVSVHTRQLPWIS
jgi:hypothetical protein